MHVMVIGGLANSLLNFRAPLLRALAAAGHRVTAMAAPTAPATAAAIEALAPGLRFQAFPLARSGLNPLHDARTWRALRRLIAAAQPDVVLAYTVKPVVWSGLALASLGARGRRIRFFALITGLGYAFQGAGVKRRALTGVVSALYRRALAPARHVFFQNHGDRDLFVARGLVNTGRTSVVAGSGVDLAHYAPAPWPSVQEPPTRESPRVVFLLIARLLVDKGLCEYAAAARQVRRRHPEAVFRLVGPPDPSPNGVPATTLAAWQASGDVEYLGATTDVRPWLADCHVYVLPSYHEGMPRTVLEAMALGRPVLATDIPAAREAVIPGLNGWLVPPRDAAALAERCRWFIDHPEAWRPMGAAGRQRAETVFDVHRVNAAMLGVMELA